MSRAYLARAVRASFSEPVRVIECSELSQAKAVAARAIARQDDLRLVVLAPEAGDGAGLSLLEELARLPAVKVVASRYSDEAHILAALQAGADGYVLKDERFEVLVQELQKLARGFPPLSSVVARWLLLFARQRVNAASTEPPALNTNHHQKLNWPAFAAPPQATLRTWEAPEHLTPRESEVLTFLSKGCTIKEIAALMGIKWFTVNDHIKAIYRKLDVSSRAEAAVFASKQGLV